MDFFQKTLKNCVSEREREREREKERERERERERVRNRPREVFLGRSVPKLCHKFTGENPCRSMISIKF